MDCVTQGREIASERTKIMSDKKTRPENSDVACANWTQQSVAFLPFVRKKILLQRPVKA